MHHKQFSHPPVVISLDNMSGAISFTSSDSSVTITNNSGTIDLKAVGGGGGAAYYTWSVVTGSTSLVTGNGYVSNSASVLPFTLPATAAVGDHYKITGFGAGGWTLGQNAGQTIHLGNNPTTTGTGGSIASQNRYDGIELICVEANTDFVVVSAYDTLTVT